MLIQNTLHLFYLRTAIASRELLSDFFNAIPDPRYSTHVTSDQWGALKRQKNGKFLSVQSPAGTFTKFYSQSIRRWTLFIKPAPLSWTRFRCCCCFFFFFFRTKISQYSGELDRDKRVLSGHNDSVTRSFPANVRWYLADFYFLEWLMNENVLRIVKCYCSKKLIAFFFRIELRFLIFLATFVEHI